jgi:hypothetical protein
MVESIAWISLLIAFACARLESSDGLGALSCESSGSASNGAAIRCEGDTSNPSCRTSCELMISRHSYRTFLKKTTVSSLQV